MKPSEDEMGVDGERMNRVLVLDAHRNHSLDFARSMSRKGVGVTAGCRSRLGPAMLSRYVDGRYVHPDYSEDPEAFVDHLVRFLRDNPHAAVVPMADRSHTILSRHKDRISETGTAVGVEDWDRFTTANNKKTLVELARARSVPVPDTRAPESIADVREFSDDLSYPVLIKPRFTTVRDSNGTYREARISDENYVRSPSELVPTFRSFVERDGCFRRHPPIVQEVIPGTTVATGALAEDGEILASFQETRVRTYPIEGGVGAVREGIHEPDMLAYSEEIVDALGWTGPVYVEFMLTPDGEFFLIEVNGRYWGSLGLAVNSGVDFPWYHYQQLRGIDVEYDSSYRIGVRQRRLFYTDIKWLLAKLSRGEVSALVPFAAAFLTMNDDVLSLNDPLPPVGSVLWAGKRIVEKATHSSPSIHRESVDTSVSEISQ
jgi:predicted ATP-grasp superfamily ATP-dependent carboligase